MATYYSGIATLILLGLLQIFSLVEGVEPSYNLCEIREGFSLNGDFFPKIGDTSRVYINLTGTKPDENYKCLMRFTTCNDCKFRVEALSNFAYQNCLWTTIFNNYDGKCAPGCTYLHLFDPDYRNETARSFTTSPWAPYLTLSKTLYVVVCSNRSQVKDIQLSINVTVVPKKQSIRGSAYDGGSLRKRYILSPAFPNFYAENDETYTYHFQAVNFNEFVELTFDDWNLSPKSMLWFYHSDHDGPIYGSSQRPIVHSDGNELVLKFQTGVQSSSSIRNFMGFKATYVFKNNHRQIRRAITDCGGYDMNRVGGLVTFDPKMSTNEYYDCIWVLKRHPDYSMIYAKLIEFDSSPKYYPDQPDRVEIRGGLTSLGSYKAEVTYDNVDDYRLYGFENNTGFYIRLQGRYHNARDFVLAFASYKFGDCRYHEFKCYNSRCISVSLKCDGYDHCGDNSDERQTMCGTDSGDYSRYSYTISIGVIIPMVISIFLIVVICLLIIFIRRCRTLSQQSARAGRQQVPSVSGNMARRNRRGRNRSRIRMNLTIQQDAPPTYDEVIQNTPIGYLNMAFMWSQPDVNGMINPPTYEEATSPTTELPHLASSQNVLNQSAESSSSGDSLESHPCDLPRASDSSSEGSILEDQRRPDSHSSFSSESSGSERNYRNCDSRNSQGSPDCELTLQQRQSKIVQDDFIECPVSSSTLRNKGQTTSGEEESHGKEVGAVACPTHGQGQGHSSGQNVNYDSTGSRGRDKGKKKKKLSPRHQTDMVDGDVHRGRNRKSSHDRDNLSEQTQEVENGRYDRDIQQNKDHTQTHENRSERQHRSPSHERNSLSRQNHSPTQDSDSMGRQNDSPTHVRERATCQSVESDHQERSTSDSIREQQGEVVLRVPSPRHNQRPAQWRYGGVSEGLIQDSVPENRLHGNYLSLSLDNGDEDPDIFV